MADTKTRTRKSTTPKSEPVTVNIEPPDLATPDSVNLNEPSMDDFADPKVVINEAKVDTHKRSRPVGKRPTVEQELDRLRNDLGRNASFIGLILCARDPWGGQLFLLNKDDVIEKWIDVCRINPTIRKALLSAMDMGVYATAITSTLALVIAYAAHAGMLPNSDMILGAIGGAGVTLPTDEQVAFTEAMFGMGQNGDGATN